MKKKVILGISCLCLVLLAGVIGVFVFNSRNNSKQPANVISKGAFPGMDTTAIENSLNKKQAEQNVTLNILQSITWENKDAYADVGIYNMKNSRYNLKVSISNELGDVIYASPLLKPDEKVDQAKMSNKDIKAGTYKCTADFEFFQPDTGDLYTKQSISNITVTVKK